MKLQRCEKGHYYDGDKYNTCPQCNQEETGPDRTVPVSVTGGTTLGLSGYPGTIVDNFGPDEGATVSLDELKKKESEPQDEGNTISIFQLKTEPVSTLKTETVSGHEDKTVSLSQVKFAGKQTHPSVGWLVCIAGPHTGMDFRLHAGKNKIGRDEMLNSVVLSNDHKVSRETQVEVVYDAKSNQFFAIPGPARSLGYINGTLLLTMASLSKNDVIELGETKLMLVPCCDDKFSWNSIYDI